MASVSTVHCLQGCLKDLIQTPKIRGELGVSTIFNRKLEELRSLNGNEALKPDDVTFYNLTRDLLDGTNEVNIYILSKLEKVSPREVSSNALNKLEKEPPPHIIDLLYQEGQNYENGEQRTVDLPQAIKMYRQLAKNHPPASRSLENLYGMLFDSYSLLFGQQAKTSVTVKDLRLRLLYRMPLDKEEALDEIHQIFDRKLEELYPLDEKTPLNSENILFSYLLGLQDIGSEALKKYLMECFPKTSFNTKEVFALLYQEAEKYQKGTERTQDLRQARQLYEELAKSGDPKACFMMEMAYSEKRLDLDVDEEQKQYWRNRGAELGNASSQFNLGWHYIRRHMVKEALVWFQRAAEQGHEKAQNALSRYQRDQN